MTRKQEDYASTLEGVHSQPKEILEIMATTKSATTESIERDRDSPNHGLWWPFPIKQGFNIWTVAFCGIFALSTPASGQILWKGMAVATNFSGTCTPDNQCVVDPLGHVIAVIEIRNKTSAGIKPGTNWASNPNYPGNIQQVPGTCYSPTKPNGGTAPVKDNNSASGNPVGGSNSILCYPPTQTAPSNGIFPSGGLSGSDPQLAGVPSSYEWSARTMGQVFGVALDNEGNIFTTASSVYGDFNPHSITSNQTLNLLNGLVFRIDHLTGLVTPFITAYPGATYVPGSNQIPNTNGVGLGNITFDPVHQQLLVTNFEDGKIYRLKGLSNPIGTIAGVYDPFFAAPYNKRDEGLPGFANPNLSAANKIENSGRRLWGIGYNSAPPLDGRVYFACWCQDQVQSTRSGTAFHNNIWSVALDSAGGFIPSTLRDETTLTLNPITIPPLPDPNRSGSMGTFFSSNPISDIEFSSKGNMLIAERTMWANFVTQSGITVVGNGDYGSLSGSSSGMPWASDVNHHAAHNARVFEFTPNTSGGWNTSQYYVGASTIGVGSREGSAGGVDYGYDDYPLNCEQRIWMTGDYLKIIYNGQPRDIIYGLEATKTGMSANPNYETTDYYVDLNNMFGSQTADTFDKTTIGDVDVYRDPCSSSYIEVCKSTPPGTGLVGDFSFLATNGAKEGPFFRTDLLTVPVGYCTGPVPVPAGRLEVAEASTDGVIVNDIKVSGSRQNSVVSRDLRTGSVVLDIASVAPNAASTETIVDFVNTPTGQLKICKVAGPGVPLGTKFNFTVVSQLGTQQAYRARRSGFAGRLLPSEWDICGGNHGLDHGASPVWIHSDGGDREY